MNIDIGSLQDWVIHPCLLHLGLDNRQCEQLLLGTAARESALEIHGQCPRGGLGLYRISPARHQWAWDQVLIHNPEQASRVRGLASQQQFLQNPHGELVANLAYATAIAWVIYQGGGVNPEQLTGLPAMALAWQNAFNNQDYRGERDTSSFIASYHRWVIGDTSVMAA